MFIRTHIFVCTFIRKTLTQNDTQDLHQNHRTHTLSLFLSLSIVSLLLSRFPSLVFVWFVCVFVFVCVCVCVCVYVCVCVCVCVYIYGMYVSAHTSI